jgi:hypothetical protein
MEEHRVRVKFNVCMAVGNCIAAFIINMKAKGSPEILVIMYLSRNHHNSQHHMLHVWVFENKVLKRKFGAKKCQKI